MGPLFDLLSRRLASAGPSVPLSHRHDDARWCERVWWRRAGDV